MWKKQELWQVWRAVCLYGCLQRYIDLKKISLMNMKKFIFMFEGLISNNKEKINIFSSPQGRMCIRSHQNEEYKILFHSINSINFVWFLYFSFSDVKQMWYLYVLNVSSWLLFKTFQTCFFMMSWQNGLEYRQKN